MLDFFKKIFRNKDKKPTEKQVIGKIGEDFACKYLENKSFKIIDRNYLKKWGEIDIVAKKDNIIHFIEVKSVTREMYEGNNGLNNNVSRETLGDYRAEDNLHPWKLERLRKTIETYILEKLDDNQDWQCDFVIIYMDTSKNISKVSFIEDVVF